MPKKSSKDSLSTIIRETRNDPVLFTRKVINANPTEQQIEIMESVAKNSRTAVKSGHGVGKCVGWNDKILLADGREVPAHMMIGKRAEVFSYNHETNKIEPKMAYFFDNGEQKVHKLRSHDGISFIRTWNHPLFMPDRDEYVEISSEKENIKIVRPVGGFFDVEGVELSDEFIQLLGIVCSYGKRDSTGYITRAKSYDVVHFIVSVLTKLGINYVVNDLNGAYYIKFYPKRYTEALMRFFQSHRKGEKGSFTTDIGLLSNRQIRVMLQAMFTVSRPYFYASAKSNITRIIFRRNYFVRNETIRFLLWRLGIYAMYWNSDVKRVDKTYLRIANNPNAKKFMRTFELPYPECFIQNVMKGKDRGNFWNEEFQEYRVKSNVKYPWWKGNKYPTVGIEVEDNHNFITRFALEHNSSCTSWLVLWYLVTRPLARIPITAPTMHQLKDILWAEIGKWLYRSPLLKSIVEYTDTRLSLKGNSFKKTWFAVPVSARKPENLQGFHADYIFFIGDEASGIQDSNFEVIEGALTTVGSKMLLLGNPTQVEGYFYDAFNKNKNLFNTITLSSIDSPLVGDDYIDNMRMKYGIGSNIYRYRVLGEFPVLGSPNAVIPPSWIEKSFMNENRLTDGKRRFGIDVARFGDDESVIVIKKGYNVEQILRYNNLDNVQLADEVTKLHYLWSPDEIIIETIGVGAGLYDILRHKRLKTKMLQFIPSTPAKVNKSFENAITEAWWNLRELFQPTVSGYPLISLKDDDEVLSQLSSRHYVVQPNGRVKLEDKAMHKKRTDCSPDIGDAMAIAFYEGNLRGGDNKIIPMKTIIGSDSEWEKLRSSFG